MGLELKILSQREAESYQPARKAVCISITDRGSAPAHLDPRFHGILRLTFDDINGEKGAGWIPFNESFAAQIVDFVNKYKDSVDEVVIHCYMGVSRSPGVALGLLDYYGADTYRFEKMYPLHNGLVRKHIRAMAGGSERTSTQDTAGPA